MADGMDDNSVLTGINEWGKRDGIQLTSLRSRSVNQPGEEPAMAFTRLDGQVTISTNKHH
jgi:hypothetical protein